MFDMNKPIETIIFDLGGVLIDWNPAYVYHHIIPDNARRHYFFDQICTHAWNLEQDAGRPLNQAMSERIALFPEWENEILAYYGRWEEMLGGEIGETVDVLSALRNLGKHRLLALTNWSAETFPIALERFEFLHWFEGIVVSGVEKVRKPEPAIYETLLRRYSVEPQHAVFIDDNMDNVKGAESMGINGIHFQHAAQLKQALAALQVVV
jgi:2-haloacid dehalogenase